MMNHLGPILFISFGLFTAVQAYCPSGWVQYASSCYLFHRHGLSWLESSSYCRARNAHLAVVTTHGEKDFINGVIQTLRGQYWLDGVDDQAEGVWEWASTGNKIYTDLWSPGEPNNQHQENCMETADFRNGLWNDDDCRKAQYCICEMHV